MLDDRFEIPLISTPAVKSNRADVRLPLVLVYLGDKSNCETII